MFYKITIFLSVKKILKVQYVIWTASVWNAVVHIQNIGSPAPFSSMLMGVARLRTRNRNERNWQ